MSFAEWWKERIWNPIIANIESAFWGRTKEGDALFIELRSKAPDIYAIAGMFHSKGFSWSSDPMGGSLDYHSFPRVTCARRKEDCDGYAFLWEELLRGYGERWIMYTFKKGSGHAMCVFKSDMGTYYLLSNTSVYAAAANREAFDKLFYGAETTKTTYFKP
jgi:hypothetical protein